jgi:hypothetical protein
MATSKGKAINAPVRSTKKLPPAKAGKIARMAAEVKSGAVQTNTARSLKQQGAKR